MGEAGQPLVPHCPGREDDHLLLPTPLQRKTSLHYQLAPQILQKQTPPRTPLRHDLHPPHLQLTPVVGPRRILKRRKTRALKRRP